MKDLKVGDRVYHQQGPIRRYGTIRQVSGPFVTVMFDGDARTPPHNVIIGIRHLQKEEKDERSI